MSALIVVDLQNDFLPCGALAVPKGDQVIPYINTCMEKNYTLIVATKDWHPKEHQSFASTHKKKVGEQIYVNGVSQTLWPDHCIQNTFGSQFPTPFHSHFVDTVIQKGTQKSIDSYSAFFDNEHVSETPLHAILQKKHITSLDILGLATDYCVKYTVLDALLLGYKVRVLLKGCRAVNLHPKDEENALLEMQAQGARIVT